MLMMITIGKGEIIFSRFKNVLPPVQVVLGHNHLEISGGNYTDDDDNEAKIGAEESTLKKVVEIILIIIIRL